MTQHSSPNWFTRLTQIEPSEIKGALVAFLFIFMLMASYMIMKPVRDSLPSDWGDVSLAQQWTYTFIVATIAVSIYNVLAAHITLRRLVPGVFTFFSLTFALIYFSERFGVDKFTLGKIFYVWSSVFSLFHVSVFWSYLSQHYTKSEGKRLFGFINTGASLGAICGPLLIIVLSHLMDAQIILLVTSVVLLLCLPLLAYLNHWFAKYGNQEASTLSLNSNPFSGFKELVTHNRLLGIAAFIFLLTGMNAFFYSTQTEMLGSYSIKQRTEILGGVELAASIVTILLGVFATNRISRRYGMATTLSSVPFVVGGLLLLLSMNPAIMLVLAFQVLRRAGNYAITRPAREILFTAVDREARFKTKPIIDVAVYRGGDVFWIWVIALLGDGGLKLGLPALLCFAAGVALIWGLLGIYLGRKHDAQDRAEAEALPSA